MNNVAGDEFDPLRAPGAPGASTQRRYDSLAAQDADRRRENLVRAIVTVVGGTLAAGLVVYALTRAVNVGYQRWVESLPGQAGARPDVLNTQAALMLVAITMLGAATTLGRSAWGRKQTTEAYRIGAEGERGAAKLLAPLGEAEWVLLHDRRFPNGRENIDHLAIGPGGVIVVETKNWSGKVLVTQDGLRRNGHDEKNTLDQVQRQVTAVQRIVNGFTASTPVRPIVFVRRAEIERRGTRRSPARPRGIRVCGPKELLAGVTDAPAELTPQQVAAIARRVDQAMPPA